METYALSKKEEKKMLKLASHERYDLVSIQLKAGQEIPTHDAPHIALVIVRSGKVLFTVEGQELILTGSEVLHMEPKEKHSLKAIEDCQLFLLKLK